MLRRTFLAWIALTIALDLAPAAALAQPSFLNFETGPVRPLALSDDGATLYATNTPDARLEIFDVTGAAPTLRASVAVGLEPVAVAVESPGRVWVVNHLSDSVSIVDVGADPPRVVRTLLVGDEPRDVVFAGAGRRRAFITSAHRGQSSPTPRGEFATPGVGRADVWVFDADALGAPLGGTPLTVLTLFGDVPRALAVSPDGATVYASVFLSGNGTTTVGEGLVCDGGPDIPACDIEGTTYPGGLPAPRVDHSGAPAPEVGLIVRQRLDGGPWEGELGRDWSAAVRFELPDEDVFAIDAMADPPTSTRSWSGVGTVNFAMAVNPVSGDIYVANTEAINEVRFEGPGTFVRETGARPADQPASVRGHLHEARITVLSGDTVTPRHLNPHIDYEASSFAADVRTRTLATPSALDISADGSTLYVAALGSSAVGVISTAELESGTLSTDASRIIPLRDPWPGGPVGLVLDEARGRLFVLTRFDNTVVEVDLPTRAASSRARMHTPEDEATVIGRPVLYDAFATSGHGEASCASCHVFGDLDGLAWDLGDPDGDVAPNPNPIGPIGIGNPFSPLKGPMTTQSLRGLADHGPMHWRGDRTSGADPLDEVAAFEAFNVAFEGLIGRDEPLVSADIARFAQFSTRVVYPPNPIRRLDNTLRDDEARGERTYFDRSVDAVATCDGCHTLDRAQGFFGGDGRTTFEGETQEFKIPHLRNAYQKVGMFGMPSAPFIDSATDFSPTGPQVRGFGFLHDGSIDTLERFFHAEVFIGFSTNQERRDVEAFVMAFDSNLPPIVGQQVTLDADSDAAAIDRANLFVARAGAPLVWPGSATTTECELVARVVLAGEERGYLLESDGLFHSDRATDAPLDLAGLLALASGGDSLTLTCAPPGAGERMAHDRDEDGVRDGDERDLGTDPAERAFFTIPEVVVPEPPPPVPDAGPPLLDGGAGADAGVTPPAGGCGCNVGRRRDAPWLPVLLVFLGLGWARRRG